MILASFISICFYSRPSTETSVPTTTVAATTPISNPKALIELADSALPIPSVFGLASGDEKPACVIISLARSLALSFSPLSLATALSL